MKTQTVTRGCNSGRPIPEMTLEQIARFWSRVDTSAGPDGCWPNSWKPSDKYGKISINGSLFNTNRVAYVLGYDQQIKPGMLVLHSCDNPRCCNPAHLSQGTHDENMRQKAERWRHDDSHTDEQVAFAVRLVRDRGMSHSAVARLYGVSKPTVRSWAIGKHSAAATSR